MRAALGRRLPGAVRVAALYNYLVVVRGTWRVVVLDNTSGAIMTLTMRRKPRNGCIEPVLKHGLRSADVARVLRCQTSTRNESELGWKRAIMALGTTGQSESFT